MLEYFFNVKNRDIAHRQKFVVVSTALSFLLILGIWVPFQVMRLRSMAGKATVAENKVETVSPSPVVAGDNTTRNLPFLSGVGTIPAASASPSSTTKPILTSTVTPDSEADIPLLSSPSPESATATPSASDFPTL
jgi:hypothetical protein